MPIFTVIGVYADNLENRYADHVEADDAKEAEQIVQKAAADEGLELIIAGVVVGKVDMVA